MPLYFRPRRRRPLGRRAQFAIAFGVLAVVLLCLASWLAVRYYMSRDIEQPESSEPDSSIGTEYTAEDTATMLVLLTDSGAERFLLVQAAPADRIIYVAPLPAATLAEGQQTLAQILHKNGPAKATAATAAITGLPVSHYMALTTTAAQTYLSELESGLTYTLPEAVRFTDEDGATVSLKAGEHPLTAVQTAGLLRYTGWSDPALWLQTGGDVLAALLNQYLLPGRSLQGDFASLSNLAQTDLRINDFNAYRQTLLYLADANTDGSICRRIHIPGETDSQGHFIPDSKALQDALTT